MALTPAEIAKQERFAQIYARSQCSAILSVERRVCGCDYGGNSWTTRDEARRMAELLGLEPGVRLLDVGAGAGWPGLYMAKETGCEAMLVDLPLTGLQIATDRAAKDGISERCGFAVADGTQMPFPNASFDAVSHSDILCCLQDKRGVLEACRRVIRETGRMAFTVIWIAPGLSRADHRRALDGAPEFAEVEVDYPTLLAQTGWTVIGSTDITEAYGSSVRRQLRADRELKDDLEPLLGVAEFAERQAGWRCELSAIEDGLLRRDLFVATPR
jgi:cyclopropane fatty-acyl-phospholipid synthase-like methyltransferase